MSMLFMDDLPLYIFERFFVLYTFIIHRVRKYYLQGSLNYFNKYLAWYWTVQASNSITHNWWLVKLPFWYLYLNETSIGSIGEDTKYAGWDGIASDFFYYDFKNRQNTFLKFIIQLIFEGSK